MTAAMLWTAMCIDLIVGDPRWFPHPVRGFGLVISLLEKVFRPLASNSRGLKIWGAVLALSVVIGAYFAAWSVLAVAAVLAPAVHWIVTVLLAFTTLAVKSLYIESWFVVKAVRNNDLDLARRLLSRIVSRDTARLDRERILAAAIETVAENLSDGIVAPLFYLGLGGVPLAMAFKAASTVDSMVGYRNEVYGDIGWFGARLDDAANFVPARITAALIVITAVFLRLDYRSAWRIWRRDARKHSSPNAGHPEAAMAGALNIRLGGSISYFGEVKEKPFLGDPELAITVERAYEGEKIFFACSVIMALGTGLLL